jgi:hypothetical protein
MEWTEVSVNNEELEREIFARGDVEIMELMR